jgi:hypothetical protein
MKTFLKNLPSNINSIKTDVWFAAFVALSVLFYVLMNLFAPRTIRSGTFTFTNAGLLLIAPVLVIQNVITEVWGKKTALKVTVFAIACQIFIVLLSELIIALPIPNDDFAQQAAGNFAGVFGSQWRIVTASIIAFTVGSVLNILVFAKIREKSQNKENNFRWLYLFAAFVSTLVAQFIDSTLFMVLAFAQIGLTAVELPWLYIWTSIGIGTSLQLLLETTIVVAIAVHLAKWLKTKNQPLTSH